MVNVIRNMFRPNKAGGQSAGKFSNLQDEDRTETETTFADTDSSGTTAATATSGLETTTTHSADSTENAIHRIIKETTESLGSLGEAAQKKSNSSSDSGSSTSTSTSSDIATSQPVIKTSGETTSTWSHQPGNHDLAVLQQQQQQQDLCDDEQSLPLVADLQRSFSSSFSFDGGGDDSKHKRGVSSKPTTNNNDMDMDDNCLPLSASHNILDSIANNSQDKLFEKLYEMDLNDEGDDDDEDDDNDRYFDGAAAYFDGAASYFSSSKNNKQQQPPSKHKNSRNKSVTDNDNTFINNNHFMEGSARSPRGGDDKKERSSKKKSSRKSLLVEEEVAGEEERSKRKSRKSLRDTTTTEEGEKSKRKSRKSLMDNTATNSTTTTNSSSRSSTNTGTEDSKHKSRSKSRPRKLEHKEESKRKIILAAEKEDSKRMSRSKSRPRKLEHKEESKRKIILAAAAAEKEDSKRMSSRQVVARDDSLSNHGSWDIIGGGGESSSPDHGGGEADASIAVNQTSRPNGTIANDNPTTNNNNAEGSTAFMDSTNSAALTKSPFETRPFDMSPAGSRNGSLRASLLASTISPPSVMNYYSPAADEQDQHDDNDDIHSQASPVEKTRKARGRSKSTHKRKSKKNSNSDEAAAAAAAAASKIAEGLNQEVEQLKQQLSEARQIADDFAMNQKEQQSRFELTKKELDLLKLEQLMAEEVKQEHERVQELLPPEAFRKAGDHEEALQDVLQEERTKLSRVTLALARLQVEHQEAKETAEEVVQLREQLSVSKQESNEREEAQKQERSALAGLATELTQLKMEKEKTEAAPDRDVVEKLRKQLAEALKKAEEVEEARKEDQMMLVKSTRELAEFQMDQETAMSNINQYAEIVRVNDERISSLEEALNNKDLDILEAQGIVEGLEAALQAANTRSLSQGSDEFPETYSFDSSMKESHLQGSSMSPVSPSRGERKIFGLETQASDLQREKVTALKERMRRLESASSSEKQKAFIEITMYKQQVKVAKRSNEDAQEQIKLLEALVDNLKVTSSSHGEYSGMTLDSTGDGDVAAVRAELNEAQAQLKLLGKQIQSLRAINDNLEENGTEELARRALLETRLDGLENDRISIAASLSEERTINERRNSELRDTKRHIMVLEDEIEALHTAEDQQYEETERAKHQTVHTKEEVDSLKRDHDDVTQSLEKELDAYKTETESAQRSLEAALRRVETLEAEIKNSCETHEKLEERLAQENADLQKAMKDLEQNHNIQVVTIRNELEDSRTELTSTTTELMEAQLRVRVVERQVEAYDARNQEIDQEKEKLAKAELQVERLEKDSADAVVAHRAKSEQSENKILSLETRIVDLESTREEIESAFRKERAEFQKEFEDAKEQEQQLITKIDKAQRTITDLEEVRSQAKLSYQEQIIRLAEGCAITSSLNQQLAESKEQIEVLRETLSKSQIREVDLSKEIEEARIAARGLEDELRRGNEQMEELAELSNSSRASILSLTNELADVQKQLSEQTSTAEDASRRVKTLESEIANVSSTKEHIEQKLEEETAKYEAKMVQLETDLDAREHALGGEIEMLKDRANTAADYLEQANLNKKALELELHELASRDKEQKKHLTDDFQLQIEGLKTDFNTRVTSLKKELSESNAETSAAKELLMEAQLAVKILENESKTAQESLAQLDAIRDSETKTLQTRLSALQHDQEAKKLALCRELEALKRHSEAADADVDRAESKIRVLEEVVDELEVAHDEVEALARKLQGEVSKWTAKATEWKEKSDNWEGKSVEWENRATQLAGGSDPEAPQSVFLQTAMERKRSPAETADSQGSKWGMLGSIFKKGPIEENSDTQIQDILEKNASLEAKLAELSSELVKMRSTHKEEVYKFVKKIEKLECENADYSLRLDALSVDPY
jgi:chromosome segregation ATPase